MVTSYVLTSADDVPERDPQSWVLEGSSDGQAWQELDRQDLGKPFEKRHQARSFQLAKPQTFRLYRFAFTPQNAAHFQVAEIALTGVPLTGGGTPPPADYRRELDLATGIHRTTFSQNGVKFTREAFASHPDQVMVFRYTAGKPGALSGRISLVSGQQATTRADEHGLAFAGEMPNRLKHACAVRVLPTGGTVTTEGEEIVFADCDDLTLLLAAHTNYKPDHQAGWRGADPLPLVERDLAAAQVKSCDVLRSAHVADLSGLLGRVSLNLGDSRRSWTWPWRCAMWARLGEGERAGIMVRGLLTYNTLGNLFCNHPPFQMDGNFGITGAIAEMLLQSHAGEVAILPAIPRAWATGGAFKGLKARGNFTVDAAWKDGRVIDFAIRSPAPRLVKVRVNGELRTINAARE